MTYKTYTCAYCNIFFIKERKNTRLTFHDQQHGMRRFVSDAVVDDAIEKSAVRFRRVLDGQTRRAVV